MNRSQNKFYTKIILAKCPICESSYEFSPKNNDANSYCFTCNRCKVSFCALCSLFPFHYDRACNKSIELDLYSVLISESDSIELISDHTCTKLDLDEITLADNSISHRSFSQNLLDEIYSISIKYCKANLILLNNQNKNDVLKKEIFDKMNVYICKNHREPIVFILGHKNEIEIENSEACPICHCDQFPICPEHKFKYMSYKCCNCCSTATHITFKDRKFSFLCDICFQADGLNPIISSDEHGEKKGRFFPYSDLTSRIVGRCDECERLFVL